MSLHFKTGPALPGTAASAAIANAASHTRVGGHHTGSHSALLRTSRTGKQYYAPTAEQKAKQKQEKRNQSAALAANASALHMAGFTHVKGYHQSKEEKKIKAREHRQAMSPEQKRAAAHNARVNRNAKLAVIGYVKPSQRT